ncbi:16383_t:CDS:2 [Funneliformis caledonium]|uniref:16383_t:CDS:1 n=1 Tax=Funneliformis caledonium TaxID=1117310 RepID=A0A9N8UZ79_9GLOM|nr:16383_t:CDS:2 [Funneliformis caledonium]
MFACPYHQYDKTFSRRTALREHTKSHKGQAYWKILNNISETSHDENLENIIKHSKDDTIMYNNNENDDNIQELEQIEEMEIILEDSDADSDSNDNNVNNLLESIESISDAEIENVDFDHIPNYTLYIPERIEQITLIDTRSTSNQNFPSFSDAAYTEFIELISKYHLSDSAENAVLKWFNKHHLREDVILPKNTTQGLSKAALH